MSKPTIFRKPQGPIVVRGEINLTDPEGNSIEHGPRFSLCGCGLSKICPFVTVRINKSSTILLI